MIFPTFQRAIEDTKEQLEHLAHLVHGTHWQSRNISDKPEMRTREIFDVHLKISLSGITDLDHWRKDIEPNLPWADDHFEERVSGHPWNPGEQWANWPWSLSADTFRTDPVVPGPLLAPECWAYVAGFFDGDGTIHFHTQKGREHSHIRLQIGQKQPEVLEKIRGMLQIGTVVQKKEAQVKELNGRTYEQRLWRWAVGSHSEVLWALKNLLPYLTVKKEKATEAIQHLEANPPSVQGSPRKGVWDKEWEPRFSHSYMQRYWPCFDNGERPRGMMYGYGDLCDVLDLLAREPLTRQAYLPVWFPEDTGVHHKERVPCTLGYHWIMRHDYLHSTYYIRSCDFIRHFRDDLYLTLRLQLWLLRRLKAQSKSWQDVKPGYFVFNCVSMHMFLNDYNELFGIQK